MTTFNIKDYHTRQVLAFGVSNLAKWCDKHPDYLPHHKAGKTWIVIKK